MSVGFNATGAGCSPIQLLEQYRSGKSAEFGMYAEEMAENDIIEVLDEEAESPLSPLLGKIIKMSALGGNFFPRTIHEEDKLSCKSWSWITFKTLQGVVSRRSELEEVGIPCPQEPITVENFEFSMLKLQQPEQEAQEHTTKSIAVCLKIFFEEQYKAEKEVYGEPFVQLISKISQQSDVADAVQNLGITAPFRIIGVVPKIIEEVFAKLHVTSEAYTFLKDSLHAFDDECRKNLDKHGSDLFRKLPGKIYEENLTSSTCIRYSCK